VPCAHTFGTIDSMWYARFRRLRSAIGELASDPHAQGQAAKVAGLALLADGLVGLENPLDGKKSRSGIFGALFPIVFGAAFFASGAFVIENTSAHEGGVLTEGRVISVERSSGGNSCSLVVAYEIGGEQLTTSSASASTEQCDDVGRTVEVSYLPDQPGSARVVEGDWLGRIFQIVGGVILLSGLWLLLVRLVALCAGVYLWFWGRRRTRQHPPSATSDWMAQLRSAWTGGVVADAPADASAQLGGLISGVVGLVRGESAAQPRSSLPQQPFPQQPAPPDPADRQDSSVPPQPQAPAGWYPDETSPTGRRWWNGNSWTPHT
jgi:hypothetical protein